MAPLGAQGAHLAVQVLAARGYPRIADLAHLFRFRLIFAPESFHRFNATTKSYRWGAQGGRCVRGKGSNPRPRARQGGHHHLGHRPEWRQDRDDPCTAKFHLVGAAIPEMALSRLCASSISGTWAFGRKDVTAGSSSSRSAELHPVA